VQRSTVENFNNSVNDSTLIYQNDDNILAAEAAAAATPTGRPAGTAAADDVAVGAADKIW